MDFSDVLRSRRMTRHFTPDSITDDVVERIIAAGLRAPSAGYSQGCSLLVLRTDEERERLWKTHSEVEGGWSPSVAVGVRNAPLAIVVLTSKDIYLDRYALPDKGWTDRDEARWPVPYWHVDAGCVAMLLLLAADNEGLGALLFGIVPNDIPAFRRAFGVPQSVDVVGCVAIGWRDPSAPKRDLRSRRRPVDELVHRGHW